METFPRAPPAARRMTALADAPELAALETAHDVLAARLRAAAALGASDDERARLKGEIAALFRQVQHARAAVAQLEEEVRGLAGQWKALAPAGSPTPTDALPAAPPPAEPAAGAPSDSRDASAPSPDAAAGAAADAAPAVPAAPVAPASVRVDHLGASTHIAKGWSRLAAGDGTGAEEQLRRALALAPTDAEAGALLAWALNAQGRTDDALAVAGRVLAEVPTHALARVAIGQACLHRGLYGEAIEHLAKAIRDDTDRKATLYATYHLGVVYLRREMHDDAVAFFRRALALGPNLIEAYHEMGRAQWKAGERAAALETWRAGAAAGKFSAWGARCEARRAAGEAGEEPADD